MKAELIEASDHRWEEALPSCEHDVYHRPGWTMTHSSVNGSEPLAVSVVSHGQTMLCPIERRQIEGDRWDAISPYGYPGPVFSSTEPDFTTGALEAARLKLVEAGAVSWFIRLHPILNRNLVFPFGTIVEHGMTVSTDLHRERDAIWEANRSSHRRDIRRAIEAGVSVETTDAPQDWRAFMRLYKETMDRLEANSEYYFGGRYFNLLQQHLGDDVTLFVARLGDAVVAGSVFTASASSGIAQYHLSATATEALRLQPSKVILHHAQGWAHDRGLGLLHLGGGVGAGSDGLLQFKRGFGQVESPFRTVRAALDPDEYNRRSNSADAHRDLTGFFPRYCHPTPVDH